MKLRCLITGHRWERTDERVTNTSTSGGGIVSTSQYTCTRCGKTTLDIVEGG